MGDNFVNLTVSGNLNLQGANVTGLTYDKITGLTSALGGKANLMSPSFTGTPTAPTALPANNTIQLATTAFVHKAISDIGDNAPEALNTLNLLATALGGDANLSVTVTNSLASKAPLYNAGFTGTVYGVTSTHVGLGNVSNTSDANLQVSTLTQTALDAKAPRYNPGFTGTVQGVTPAHVGLGNVSNTSDANLPVSTLTQTALDAKAPRYNPGFTGSVGGINKIMIALENVSNTSDANLPISDATRDELALKLAASAAEFNGNAATVTNGVYTAGDQTIGGIKTFLSTIVADTSGNAATVTNCVYTTGNQTIGGIKTFLSTIGGSIYGNAATTTKLLNRRYIADQPFDGTSNINITYGNLSDGSTLATKTYVSTAISNLINGATDTMDTLKELADALNNDANSSTTIITNLASKAPLYNAGFTGTVRAPTAADRTNTTQIATTSFIQNIVASTNVTLGQGAGYTSQKTGAVAVGKNAGYTNQGTQAVAIGESAGQYTQGQKAVAIGLNAGHYSQGGYAVAIGDNAGAQSQGVAAVSIGSNAGAQSQGVAAVAIGNSAGYYYQGQDAVSIGYLAGNTSQKSEATAIGAYAGINLQNPQAVAIGFKAGGYKQGTQAIAIGAFAGSMEFASINYDVVNNNTQRENSIIINNIANTGLFSTGPGLFVGNIRFSDDTIFSSRARIVYDADTKEVSYRYKSFVIDHPTDEDKYLVHACLEGPEAGVYYRGEGKIVDNLSTTIDLPDYVEHLASEFTVQLTRIYPGKKVGPLYAGRVKNNSFAVYGENCEFYWQVTGKRFDIEVEPSKDTTNVNGSGPYKWI